MRTNSIFTALLLCVTSVFSQQVSDTIQHYELKEVVVTGTKTERNPLEIPTRISVIRSEIIESSATMQLDDILRFSPGVNVNRVSGIYSQRPMVTIRGLSGNEQARTLVLLNGIPINTSDEGGVNWNRINQFDVERIEVFKGPGSSLYGNSAMGGVINIITKKPKAPQEVYSGVSYGTYNTLRQDLNVRIRTDNGYYGVLSQYYIQSDGYNSVPIDKRTPYDTDRFLEAIGASARVGYTNSKWLNWEMQYDVFRDKRGEGYQIYAPDGCYRNFNTNLVRGNLRGGNQTTTYTLSGFYQLENYYDINERMRGTNYSRYDVNSFRKDMGGFLNVNHKIAESNTLTGGFEYKVGSISGGDYYQTAPYDTIYNAGKLNTLAGYIQDEHSMLDKRIILITGLRFDRVTFADGDYYTTDPWNTIPELNDYTWTELSPRAGVRLNFIEQFSGYLSYSQGFRASILDDLTRTGWMWVGPKYANPELEPESINNYEIGFDAFPMKNLKISSSAFITKGKDFLYYVSTGDSLFNRPIYQRENVTNVDIRGFETEIDYNLMKDFWVLASYTFTDSRIVGFTKRPDLEGKYLTYTPKHIASVSVFWKNPYVNISTRAFYKGEQFGDDANNVGIDSYVTIDLQFSKTFRKKLNISVDIQNILNDKHIEAIDFISPGRLITTRLGLNF